MKKPRQPEIYYGKTGVDLPVLQVVPLSPTVFASYTGPDGGLTQVSRASLKDSISLHTSVQAADPEFCDSVYADAVQAQVFFAGALR